MGVLSGTGVSVRYQPIVDTHGRPNSVEALAVVSQGPHAVAMSDIIDQVRDSGLLPALGRHVHRQALSAFHRHDQAGLAPKRLSLNASAQELCARDFATSFLQAADVAAVDPTRLVVELTEDMALPDVGAAKSAIVALQDEGVCVSLDDFGNGSNGFVALRRLPVKQIKLDRSLIEDASDQDVLIAGVISIAHQMGIEVVAEGIESKAQADLMADLGCDLFQGFWWGRPGAFPAIA